MTSPEPRPGVLGVVACAAAVLAGASWLRSAAEPFDPKAAAPSAAATGRWIRDDYEFSVYLRRGAWAPTGLRPYLDVLSEYPQLATWSFGIPYAFPAVASLVPMGEPRDVVARIERTEPWAPLSLGYGDVASALFGAAWLATIALAALLARDLGLSPWRAALALGPASVYFALQRFDPLPALALAGALLALTRDRAVLGFGLLAVGTMVKWYPAVVAPVAFAVVARRQGWRRATLAACAFAGVVVVCAAPTFLAGLGDPTWSGKPLSAFASGIAALRAPYEFQGARYPNPGSLAERWLHSGLGVELDAIRPWLRGLQVLQVLAALGLAIVGWRSPRPATLVAASAAAVTAFVLLNPIFSPQFVCWTAPLVAVAGRGRLGAAALVAGIGIDALTLVQFPILYFQATPSGDGIVLPSAFYSIVHVRIGVTIACLAILAAIVVRARSEPAAGA
ncbi:MAG TPA: glycosyltransferase 87 family protein [Planctomycetota bacterium]|nr:glycosyltransferase 87 family protein [Planctomycetota bacterium]